MAQSTSTPTETEPLEGDIQISFTGPRAEAIITEAGWTIVKARDKHRRTFTYYVRPGGESRLKGGLPGIDYVWHLDEALADALSTSDQPRCAGVAA